MIVPLLPFQCPSFRAFKQRLGDILDGYGRYNRVFPYTQQPIDTLKYAFFSRIIEDIAALARQIDLTTVETICDLLHRSKDVHFYCEFSANHAKQLFQIDLVYSDKQVISLSDPSDQMEDMKNLTCDSVVITTTQAALKHYAAHLKEIRSADSNN